MRNFKDISADLRAFTQGVTGSSRANVRYEDIVSTLEDIVRLFSGCQAQASNLIELDSNQFSSTDAAIVIAALMKAQDLNTFDIGLWLAKQHPKSSRLEVQ
jgi:hypothetical protein